MNLLFSVSIDTPFHTWGTVKIDFLGIFDVAVFILNVKSFVKLLGMIGNRLYKEKV